MAVSYIFSKRQKRLRGEGPDVYIYDALPHTLRVQVVLIVKQALGSPYKFSRATGVYNHIVLTLCREYGLFALPPSRNSERFGAEVSQNELFEFFLNTDDVERALDVVELTFRMIHLAVPHRAYGYAFDGERIASNAIEELNVRFQEAGVGYQFASGEIIRVDSQLVHAEVIKPALSLLNQRSYAGPEQEFLNAFEYFRHGRTKEAMNDCLKAFESTMKAICDKRGWTYQPTDTVSKLLQICFEKELVPTFWQTQLTALRSLLESSVPTGRNKMSGHGQGSAPTNIPNHIAAYMLHMTASAIVFLATAEADMN